MRRTLISLVALALCLVASACGSGSSSTGSSPLATELSYFPSGSPFVASIATNPTGPAVQNAEGLLGAYPGSSLGIAALESELGTIGLNYHTDIEPLFGNPVAFGVLQVPGAVSVSGADFLAVWVTKSAAKLDALVKKFPGLSSSTKVDGATVYGGGPVSTGATVAVDGATLLFGASKADVEAALSRHADGGGITSANFSSAMGNLPQNALIRAFGSLTSALSTPQTATARKVPWVGAISSYGAAISAGSGGLTAQFRIATSGGSLTTAELPIAAGTASPSLGGTLPITVAVRDPAQSYAFIKAALQVADPAAYARYTKGDGGLKRKTGYDLDTFAGLLTGNLIVETDTRTTMGRADVSDPASAAKQLALVPKVLHDIFPSTKSVSRVPGGMYEVKDASGKSFSLGLVGHEFVAGVATPAQLRAFAAAPTTPASTQGSVAFRVSLLALLRIVSKGSSSAIVQSVLSNLGDITGSAAATTSALTGGVSLGVK